MSLLVCRSYHLMTTYVFENHVLTMKSVSQCWSLAMHLDLFPVIQSCFDRYILSQHLLADAQGVSQVSCLIKRYDNMQGHYLSDSMHHYFIWTMQWQSAVCLLLILHCAMCQDWFVAFNCTAVHMCFTHHIKSFDTDFNRPYCLSVVCCLCL